MIRIAAAQMSATDQPEENLATIRSLIADAAAAGARIVVFPEAAMIRFGVPLRQAAEPLDGPFAEGVRAAAREAGVTVVVGMFTPNEDGRVRNTLLATGPAAEASYDKIHLFDAFGSRESKTVAPGERIVTVEAEGVTIGLATCYDLRFADQFTALGRAGAELICVPASWGDGPGKAEQWDLLTRARAMDAQAWLVACGQAWVPDQGADPLGIGRSVVVDPMGRVRGRLGHETGLLIVDIDTSTVQPTRERIPIL